MPRRSELRQFPGIKETRKIKRVVVSGGNLLRHREQWAKHGKEWLKPLEDEKARLETLPRPLIQSDQIQLDGLTAEIRNWPSEKAIALMPTKEELRDSIHSMVRRTTEFMIYFSRLLLFHVHRCLDDDTLTLPAMDTQGLQKLRQVCNPSGYESTREKNRADPKLRDFAQSVDRYNELIDPAHSSPLQPELLTGLSQTTNYEMAQHAVSISNHLVFNFTQRCERWLKFRAAQLEPASTAARRKQLIASLMRRVFSTEEEEEESGRSNVREEYQPEPFKPTSHESASIATMFEELCNLRPDPTSMEFPVNKDWLKKQDNWRQLLSFYRSLNSLFNKHNLRQFDLLPLCSFRARCITVDHDKLCELFHVPTKQRETTPWSWFMRLSSVHLDRYPGPFRTTPSSVLTDGFRFIVRCEKFLPKQLAVQPSEILSKAGVSEGGGDGKDAEEEEDLDKQLESSASSSKSKSKKRKRPQPKQPEEIERRPFDKPHGVMRMSELERFPGPVEILGVDPGVRDLYAVVDENNNYSRLTRRQFDHMTGKSGDKAKLDKWKQRAGLHELENSISTSSASSTAEFEHHIKSFFKVSKRLREFYGARRVTRMRMKAYVRRDKVIDGFIGQVFLDKPPPISKRTRMRRKRRDRRKRKKAKRRQEKQTQSQPQSEEPPKSQQV